MGDQIGIWANRSGKIEAGVTAGKDAAAGASVAV